MELVDLRQEEAMAEHARYVRKLPVKLLDVGQIRETAVEDRVALIGQAISWRDRSTQIFDLAPDIMPGERQHVERDGRLSQSNNQFGWIDNADHCGGSPCDDLLTQERAPSTLHGVQLRIDLIGAVNCKIDASQIVEGDHVQSQPLCQHVARQRACHAAYPEAGCDTSGQRFDRKCGSRSGAESNQHAWLHRGDRACRYPAFRRLDRFR